MKYAAIAPLMAPIVSCCKERMSAETMTQSKGRKARIRIAEEEEEEGEEGEDEADDDDEDCATNQNHSPPPPPKSTTQFCFLLRGVSNDTCFTCSAGGRHGAEEENGGTEGAARNDALNVAEHCDEH